MMFHVAGLLQEPVGAVRRHEVAEEIDLHDEQIQPVGPVSGDVKLTKTNAGVLVTADLHLTVQLNCGRCLTEMQTPLGVRFSEEYLPTLDMITGLPTPRPEDGSVFTIDENHVLDLSEALRQYALLELPMAPLCRVDCAGLCPVCGHNRNEGNCACTPEMDARWRALGELIAGAETEPAGKESTPKKRHRRS